MLDENKEEAEWYDVDVEKVVCTTPNDAVVDENKDEATWCDVDANASPTSSSSSNATPLCLLFIIVDHCIVRRVPHCLLYVDVTLPPLHSHGPSHEEEKEAEQSTSMDGFMRVHVAYNTLFDGVVFQIANDVTKEIDVTTTRNEALEGLSSLCKDMMRGVFIGAMSVGVEEMGNETKSITIR
ncbi:hypothetical protein BHE74_00006659 [Ensete ventricosum]|nr:hypothetical protein BHE74_00006659 [Ensete ventricosum]